MITNKPGKQNIRKINTGQALYKPYGYGQAESGPPPDPPLFDGVIADINAEDNKAITPIDVSGNFDTGGAVTNYSILFGPSWLNISNGGIMSGTPDEAGTTVGVQVRGSNAGGSAVSNTFDTIVAPEAPVFDGVIADIVGFVGTPITPVDVSGNYDTGGAVDTYTLQNEPTWMSISAAGVITGTPDVEAVTINITVVGSNATGGAPSNPFQMDAQAAGPAAPLFDGTIANIVGTVGTPITPVDVSGNFDTGGAVSTYTLQNNPTWMSIDNAGLITGTPDAEAITNGVTVTGANGTPPDAVSNAFQVDVQAAAGFGDSMVSVWRTTVSPETITLPAVAAINNFEIDWGDGTVEQITAASPSHEYAAAGDYEIKITGLCPFWTQDNLGDKDKLIEIKQIGVLGFNNGGADGYCYGCTNLVAVSAGNNDVQGSGRLTDMFRGCTSLATVDVSTINTSTIISIDRAFREIAATSIDLSAWDTSSMTSMLQVFRDSSNMDTAISTFNIGLVTGMTSMMEGTSFGTTNYDAALISFDGQPHQQNVKFHAGSAVPSAGAATTAKNNLVADGWTITDGLTVFFVSLPLFPLEAVTYLGEIVSYG